MGINLTRSAICGLALTLASGLATADPDGDGSHSMKVAIDKETGKLRAATAQEAAELARLERIRERAAPSGSEQAPLDEAEAIATMRVFPSGHVGMELPLSLYSTLQATISEDGTVQIEHVDPAHDHAEHDHSAERGASKEAGRDIQ